MSLSKVLICDRCGTRIMFDTPDVTSRLLFVARDDYGWTVTAVDDLCHTCAAHPEIEWLDQPDIVVPFARPTESDADYQWRTIRNTPTPTGDTP